MQVLRREEKEEEKGAERGGNRRRREWEGGESPTEACEGLSFNRLRFGVQDSRCKIGVQEERDLAGRSGGTAHPRHLLRASRAAFRSEHPPSAPETCTRKHKSTMSSAASQISTAHALTAHALMKCCGCCCCVARAS
eukprot:810394-Rhodomonas_salina.1